MLLLKTMRTHRQIGESRVVQDDEVRFPSAPRQRLAIGVEFVGSESFADNRFPASQYPLRVVAMIVCLFSARDNIQVLIQQLLFAALCATVRYGRAAVRDRHHADAKLLDLAFAASGTHIAQTRVDARRDPD
jgi:hypothetical protein